MALMFSRSELDIPHGNSTYITKGRKLLRTRYEDLVERFRQISQSRNNELICRNPSFSVPLFARLQVHSTDDVQLQRVERVASPESWGYLEQASKGIDQACCALELCHMLQFTCYRCSSHHCRPICCAGNDRGTEAT